MTKLSTALGALIVLILAGAMVSCVMRSGDESSNDRPLPQPSQMDDSHVAFQYYWPVAATTQNDWIQVHWYINEVGTMVSPASSSSLATVTWKVKGHDVQMHVYTTLPEPATKPAHLHGTIEAHDGNHLVGCRIFRGTARVAEGQPAEKYGFCNAAAA